VDACTVWSGLNTNVSRSEMLRRNMRAYHPVACVVIPAITRAKRATIESIGATSFPNASRMQRTKRLG